MSGGVSIGSAAAGEDTTADPEGNSLAHGAAPIGRGGQHPRAGFRRDIPLTFPMIQVSLLSLSEVDVARKRRLAAMRLQEIEGNPLSDDQIAMFEMFEREAWTHEKRRAYLLAKITPLAAE